MKTKVLLLLPLLPALFLAACAASPGIRKISSPDLPWQQQGALSVAILPSGLIVARADPQETRLELLNPASTDGFSVSQVAARGGFSLVINAAMFQGDYKTSIGYMKNVSVVNNSHVNPKLGGYLLFHPKKPGLPAVKIANSSAALGDYASAFQSYRMWTEEGGILWKQGSSIYRQVGLVGVDGSNRVVFFYQPNEADVHDLVASILALNLDLKGLLYLDGGFHAALFLAPNFGREWNTALHLPNLLGLKTKP